MTVGPAVVVRDVRAGYGPVGRVRPVLRSSSWEAPPGRITALVGPNGVGKTTTLRLLLGMGRATAGSLTVGGLDPAEHRRRHGVAYLPEERVRLPGWTPGALLEAAGGGTGERAGSALVPASVRARPVDTLSRGEARAVFLAWALADEPGLLVLDEPWAGLDPPARTGLARILVARAAAGATVVVSSHELLEVARVAHRVVTLEWGGRATTVERAGRDPVGFEAAVRRAAP